MPSVCRRRPKRSFRHAARQQERVARAQHAVRAHEPQQRERASVQGRGRPPRGGGLLFVTPRGAPSSATCAIGGES